VSQDPYTPPAAGDAAPPAPVTRCPRCGGTMHRGTVEGGLNWLADDATSLERFLGGQRVVGPTHFSVTLGRKRHPAARCPACGVLVVLPG